MTRESCLDRLARRALTMQAGVERAADGPVTRFGRLGCGLLVALPAALTCGQAGFGRLSCREGRGDRRVQPRHCFFLGGVGNRQQRRHVAALLGINALVARAVEEGEELVELALRDRVVLVVMAPAQPIVRPMNTVAVVSTRSTAFSIRHSSSIEPASVTVRLLRLKPVAIRCARVGEGSRSPAICSITNRSNGMFWLNASMTQSRQGHIVRAKSFW